MEDNTKKTTFFDRMYSLDRRIIYVFVFFGALLPFLVKFDLPIKPTGNVTSVYDTIEEIAKKPEGGTVLISFDFDPASAAELKPMTIAVVRHIFSHKGKVKLVGMGHWQTGMGMAIEEILKPTAAEYGVEYGKDWVWLGWKAGTASLIINMGQDFYAAFSKDTKGTDTKTMEATRRITKLADFDYVISMAAGSSGIDIWVPYGQTKYRFKMGGGCTAVMGPDYFPYLQTGQLNGLITGLVGAAEYETLIKKPGPAVEGMKPQSVVHIILIAFIIFGNVMFFMKKYRKGEGSN
jgi:hypothetical protein